MSVDPLQGGTPPDSVPSKGPGNQGIGKKPGPGYINPPQDGSGHVKDKNKPPRKHKKDDRSK